MSQSSNKKRDLYILFGPPGSGKTCQAHILCQRLKFHYVSWGKLSRDIIAGVGPYKKYQKMVVKTMEDDDHFPDGFIKNILIKEINNLKDNRGVIMDGFPRRLKEAKELIEITEKCNLKIKAIVKFNLSFAILKARVEGRMYCGACGRTYNKIYLPKDSKNWICDEDDTPLNKRPDDTLEANRTRFDYYLEESLEAYDFLCPEAESSFDINANQDENFIFSEILHKLNKKTKRTHSIYAKVASVPLPTEFGTFKLIGYQNKIDYSYHLTIVKGNVSEKRNVPVRIHSSCMTGDIFSSRKCDCGEQLHFSLDYINKKGYGVVIYLFQEGRGINILNKIKAYELQYAGEDTVEANESLGLPPEMREYDAVEDILKDLRVKSIDLMTNNPDKFNKLHSIGVIIEERIPIITDGHSDNKKYLDTKKGKMNHLL